MIEGCLVQVGNGIDLEAISLKFEPCWVASLWCDLGFFPNSRGNKAAANLCPRERRRGKVRGERGKQADRERLRKRELVSKRASKPERQMED